LLSRSLPLPPLAVLLAVLLAGLLAACTADERPLPPVVEDPDLAGLTDGGVPYPGELPAAVPCGPLLTEDGVLIYGTFLPSPAPDPAPLVLLTHGMGQTRRDFVTTPGGLVDSLRRQGFAVLTHDLRGHGESKFRQLTGLAGEPCQEPGQCRSRQCVAQRCTEPQGEGEEVPPRQEPYLYTSFGAAEWALLRLDLRRLDTLLEARRQEWSLDLDRRLFLGSDVGAGGLLRYLGAAPPGRAAVLLGPLQGGVDRLGAADLQQLAALLPRALPLLLVAGADDRLSSQALASLAQGFPTAEQWRVEGTGSHGLALLAQQEATRQRVVQWLTANR
jgi:pimeloyl-ACP methyl ester carboxylesterase